MDKQQILDEINKTKEHLANMEKLLDECKYEKWKPKDDDIFYYVDTFCRVIKENWADVLTDRINYNHGNCFQTREQAEQEAEKILIRRQLESIARRLNKGEYIDWDDEEQAKYSISLDNTDNEISWDKEVRFLSQGTIYCLDMNFYKVAIEEIGEERLIRYLESE